MKTNIRERWLDCQRYDDVTIKPILQPYWSPSTIEKFISISTSCPTALKLIKQFKGKKDWSPFKTYNPQFPNWEYMVLLKLVYKKAMYARIARIRGRETLIFKLSDSYSCVCSLDEPQCGTKRRGFVCTRSKDHHGRHVACGNFHHKILVWR
jgi:hypothetical protein